MMQFFIRNVLRPVYNNRFFSLSLLYLFFDHIFVFIRTKFCIFFKSQWVVVLFTTENKVEVVPGNWFDGDKCWPVVSFDKLKKLYQ